MSDTEDDTEYLFCDDYPFIGRQQYFQDLEEKWMNCKIFGIYGMRSVGKSRTVCQFLHQMKVKLEMQKSRQMKVIYIDLRKLENLVHIKNSLYARLFNSLPNYADAGDEQKDWIRDVVVEMKRNRNTIHAVVMDNAEDVIENSLKDEFISTILALLKNPISNLKIFIASTCEILLSGKGKIYFKKELMPMEMDEGVQLLMEVMEDCCIKDLDKYAKKIVSLSGRLPSVIIMAGSELKEDDGLLTPVEMVELLTKCRLEILSRDFYPSEDRTEFQMKKFIERLNPIFMERLAILGYIPGMFNDQEAVGILDHDSSAEAKHRYLIPLRKKHMLEFNTSTKRFDIHGLLRDCLNVMDIIKDITEVRNRYAKVFSAVFLNLQQQLNSPSHSKAMTELNQEQVNLQKLVVEVKFSNYNTFPFFVNMVETGQELINNYIGGDCFQLYDTCLELSYKFGSKLQKAIILIGYGRAYTNVRGHYQSAVEKLEEALRILEQLPPNKTTAQAYQGLGFTFQRKGQNDEAIQMLEKALEIETELGMVDDTLTLSTLSSLGIVHVFVGNFERGKKFHFEALARRKKKFGTENHPHIGSTYNNIGILFDNMGETEEAIFYYKKGLDIKKKQNATPTAIIISLNNVAMQHCKSGDCDAALKMLNEAKELMSASATHSTFVESLLHDNLGQVYLKLGQYHDAIKAIERAILIRESAVPNSLVYVESMKNLGLAYMGIHDTDNAMLVLNKAVSLRVEVQQQMPRCKFIYECLLCMLDIQMEKPDQIKAQEYYVLTKQELLRILGIFNSYQNHIMIFKTKEDLEALELKFKGKNKLWPNYYLPGGRAQQLVQKESLSSNKNDSQDEMLLPGKNLSPELSVNFSQVATELAEPALYDNCLSDELLSLKLEQMKVIENSNQLIGSNSSPYPHCMLERSKDDDQVYEMRISHKSPVTHYNIVFARPLNSELSLEDNTAYPSTSVSPNKSITADFDYKISVAEADGFTKEMSHGRTVVEKNQVSSKSIKDDDDDCVEMAKTAINLSKVDNVLSQNKRDCGMQESDMMTRIGISNRGEAKSGPTKLRERVTLCGFTARDSVCSTTQAKKIWSTGNDKSFTKVQAISQNELNRFSESNICKHGQLSSNHLDSNVDSERSESETELKQPQYGGQPKGCRPRKQVSPDLSAVQSNLFIPVSSSFDSEDTHLKALMPVRTDHTTQIPPNSDLIPEQKSLMPDTGCITHSPLHDGINFQQGMCHRDLASQKEANMDKFGENKAKDNQRGQLNILKKFASFVYESFVNQDATDEDSL